MALMSLRIRSHVKESMVLTRADNLFIHNYIRSILNIILRPMGLYICIHINMHIIKLINGPDEARTRVILLVCLTP